MVLKARNSLHQENQNSISGGSHEGEPAGSPSIDEELGDETERLINGEAPSNAQSKKDKPNGKNVDKEGNALPESFVLPTRTLSIIILALLAITYNLLGRACNDASDSHARTFDFEDGLSSRSITYWRALPGKTINVRYNFDTKRIIGNFSASEAKSWEYFEVYGEPHEDQLHIVSPMNGWTTEITTKGERFLERIPDEEDPLMDRPTQIPFCPIYDAGRFAADSTLKRYQYAPTKLIVAQQFWNASQVLYYFLLIALHSALMSSSCTSSTSGKKNAILWRFLILFTFLTVFLIPFSAYCTSPGGHILALIMTITSLATVYSSPPNIHFDLIDLPPQCCTPKQYAADDKDSAVVVSGKGLCKVEHIAFMCNLGSSMYNYVTLGINVFPFWHRIYRCFDKLFGLTGANFELTHAICRRFIYSMGFKNYHLPLFVPGSAGSNTGANVFLCLWGILPFIYTFYFMSMYVMATRVPGVKIQRFLALFGVFHFLFLTDIVAYKYGRGYRNEISEHFHWVERLAWRIAILLPIYQNVRSGHYKHPMRNKRIGKSLHNFMAAYGIFFFVHQCVLNDFPHYAQWLRGKKQTHLIRYHQLLGYLGALVVMVFTYGFMMLGGTWGHNLFVGPDESGHRNTRVKRLSENL